jgi:nucleoside 2-deoxyribosyltransferase
MLKVYHAGPQVFEKHFLGIMEERKEIGTKYNLDIIFPYDASINSPNDIKILNKKLISICDVIVADISPFIGPFMDSGTAYEIGYAEALEKWVFLYSTASSKDLIDRIPKEELNKRHYENFGLTENLMITANNIVYESFEVALEAIVLELNM